MKRVTQHILFAMRMLVFTVVMTSLVVQPVLKYAGFLDSFCIELASIDFDEDTSEQESQVEEHTPKEIALQLHSVTDYAFESVGSGPIYGTSLPLNCFSLENNLPPPEPLS